MDTITFDLISVTNNHKIRNKEIRFRQIKIGTDRNRGTGVSSQITFKNPVNSACNSIMVKSRTGGHSHDFPADQFFPLILLVCEFPIHRICSFRSPAYSELFYLSEIIQPNYVIKLQIFDHSRKELLSQVILEGGDQESVGRCFFL